MSLVVKDQSALDALRPHQSPDRSALSRAPAEDLATTTHDRNMHALTLSAGLSLTTRAPFGVKEAEPILYSDSARDLSQVANWLRGASDQFIVRITGGCLPLEAGVATKIQNVLSESLADFRDGIILSGATRSLRDDGSGMVRPCMPEIGATLQQNLKEGRHLGIFPAANLSRVTNGELIVTHDSHRGEDWKIVLDNRVPRAIAATAETPYLWDAEWQTALKVVDNQRKAPDFRGALVVSFDGGPATERELRAWAELSKEDPRIQVLLITGGSPERSTDKLANDTTWRTEFKNVHEVSLQDPAIRRTFADLGVFGEQLNAFSLAE